MALSDPAMPADEEPAGKGQASRWREGPGSTCGQNTSTCLGSVLLWKLVSINYGSDFTQGWSYCASLTHAHFTSTTPSRMLLCHYLYSQEKSFSHQDMSLDPQTLFPTVSYPLLHAALPREWRGGTTLRPATIWLTGQLI